MPLLFDLFRRPPDVDLALPVADERPVPAVLAAPDLAAPDLDDVDLFALDFAALDLDELDLEEVDFEAPDFADPDFADPDPAVELFVDLAPALDAPPVDLDVLADAADLDVVLFFADPPLFDAEDFAAEDFVPAERPDPFDFVPEDFDAVDLAEPDFAVDLLVDFLVVAMFWFLHFCKIGFETTFRVLQ